TTDISKGLNLGVYSADLCFTTIFDQTETSCKYIASCKKLAEELSIMDAISKNTLDRMEANTNHKDSLLRIISEVLLNSDSFLKENERTSTAAIVLAGGWIEGLYIGTQIAKNTKDNKELINRIADQRFSLETLMCLLEEQKEIDANVEPVLQGIKKINDAFCKIEINKAPVEVITDTTLGKTTLNSATTVTVSPEVFNEICNSAESLRTNIVKGELI
ncbi:MAG: hypothetical protein KJ607_09770, partial [Bacteroidetes bacterium]|nr:hypothetical protein [Bacteroidota bacterium]